MARRARVEPVVSEPTAAPVAPVVVPAATDPVQALVEIRTTIGDCKRCKLCRGRTQVVFGTGLATARLMFIGEGPGRDEDLQGEPFVGAAGQLLDKMIAAMGLGRREVYIANIVKCRPPKNRDPEPDEVAACEPFLKAQIRVIKPEVIVALGRCAAQTLLRDPTPITRMRGHWREYQGIAVMPTYHPAYLLRSPSEKRPAWEDLKAVMKRLNLTPLPPKGVAPGAPK
ncbi:MAG: uracil-DNA glycosylase [Deltaproteobacteria bacterium]|nr:uracil-DNA glycosylase [Deltaproteobacteria bacterium]